MPKRNITIKDEFLDLSQNKRNILLYIRRYTDDFGVLQIPMKDLIYHTGCNRATFYRELKALQDENAISLGKFIETSNETNLRLSLRHIFIKINKYMIVSYKELNLASETLFETNLRQESRPQNKAKLMTPACVEKFPFENAWAAYGKGFGKSVAQKIWNDKLSDTDKENIMKAIPLYVEATTMRDKNNKNFDNTKRLRKDFSAFLNPNNKFWMDVLESSKPTPPPVTVNKELVKRFDKFKVWMSENTPEFLGMFTQEEFEDMLEEDQNLQGIMEYNKRTGRSEATPKMLVDSILSSMYKDGVRTNVFNEYMRRIKALQDEENAIKITPINIDYLGRDE